MKVFSIISVIVLFNISMSVAQRLRFGRQSDVAEDPDSVDDRFGWSWGAANNINGGNNFGPRPGGGGFGFNGFGGRPNSFGGNWDGNGGPNVNAAGTATDQRPTAVQQPSEEFLNCMGRCATTNEYNPVCGSDNQDYHNRARLDCAVSCGANVQFARRGTCTSRSSCNINC